MKCPVCGGSSLRRDCDRKIPYTYKGQETVLDVHGDWCPDCDEMIFSDEEAAAVEKQMADFKRLVNSQAVDPEFIQSVRKKLGLNQKQAGELFGGGVNAFSRYERGKMNPPQSLVVLLQLLNHKPELLDDVVQCAKSRPADNRTVGM